jgi:excisionase family DNA binding protein
VTVSVKEVLTVKEAADMLGVSTETIRNYIRDKRLPSSQPGSKGKHKRGGARHRILRVDVMRLVNATYEAPPSPANDDTSAPKDPAA